MIRLLALLVCLLHIGAVFAQPREVPPVRVSQPQVRITKPIQRMTQQQWNAGMEFIESLREEAKRVPGQRIFLERMAADLEADMWATDIAAQWEREERIARTK